MPTGIAGIATQSGVSSLTMLVGRTRSLMVSARIILINESVKCKIFNLCINGNMTVLFMI